MSSFGCSKGFSTRVVSSLTINGVGERWNGMGDDKSHEVMSLFGILSGKSSLLPKKTKMIFFT